ncbi:MULTISPECIES: hypothetical protein [unclassified Ruegeria]|uniref:hypothetical protein n=1 Tax=unclassified Ruegeria TaxID=2625375 RepID=UPI00148897A4|nr:MULTISPECIES: hypothetical protein [unclassified Ruegeria]
MSTHTKVPSIGSIQEHRSDDMTFERKAPVSPSQLKLAQMSPSRRRAALRTKTFTSDVNPALYAAWDELREAKELTVVRAFELSLISFLNDSGTDFKL